MTSKTDDNPHRHTTGFVTKHQGSCHCGAVRFEVDLDMSKGGTRCNCSICTKMAITSAVVKPDAFTLLSGEASLGMYEWGWKIGQRFFCKHCGIHCFGRGTLAELGGAYATVNLNAVDDLDVAEVKVVYWDGRHDNWHAGARPTPWPIFATDPSPGAPPSGQPADERPRYVSSLSAGSSSRVSSLE
jgi:hypothetical protein